MLRTVMENLPVVIVTSVIRSSYQGESHGGVYLVDLARGKTRQVIDWDESNIDWGGRGGDRGLRGIAFWQDRIYLAASDEVLVYEPDFTLAAVIGRNPYLRHCHEIAVFDDTLWLTSAGFDCVLAYDLKKDRYTVGYELRYQSLARRLRGLQKRMPQPADRMIPNVRPSFRIFDPNGADGPMYSDTTHINSVTVRSDGAFFSGRQVRHLYQIRDTELHEFATIPGGTHNAQPMCDGNVIVNDTLADTVRVLDRRGTALISSTVPSYERDQLANAEKVGDSARQAFGRGLAIWDDRYAIAGSSPATVTVHDLRTGRRCAQVNLTMDVRNAIHGLEVWPFATLSS